VSRAIRPALAAAGDAGIYGLNDWLIAHRVSSENQVCMTRHTHWGSKIVSYIEVFRRFDPTICGF
jgi:hypothetical protein